MFLEVHRRSTPLKKRSRKPQVPSTCWEIGDELHGPPIPPGVERVRDLSQRTHLEREEVLPMEKGSKKISERLPLSLQSEERG